MVADYHQKYADGMVKAARMVLQGHKVEEVRVPGTFEVPLAVKRALRKKPDAVLALGLVWQGETAHAELILKSATEALMRMMLETDIPILHHLVGVKTAKQAKDSGGAVPVSTGGGDFEHSVGRSAKKPLGAD